MATMNQVGSGLKGTTGSGNFVGSTSPTITTPVIAQINDVDGQAVIKFSELTASDVNYWHAYGSNTGANVLLQAEGSDTNIGQTFSMKGTGVPTFITTNTVGMIVQAGTTSQKTTRFIYPDTAGTNDVTYPDSSGIVGLQTSGSWTPVFTFATLGDLSVSYSTQVGSYVRIGSLVWAQFNVQGTPTYTTSSGVMRITGLPVACNSTTGTNPIGSVQVGNTITFPAGTTSLTSAMAPGQAYILITASGSGATAATFTTSQFASGVVTVLQGAIVYSV